jgi:hypothetical protein
VVVVVLNKTFQMNEVYLSNDKISLCYFLL